MDNNNNEKQGRGRGGARAGSGRPNVGHVAVKLLMSPDDAERLRALARSNGKPLGAFVAGLLHQ